MFEGVQAKEQDSVSDRPNLNNLLDQLVMRILHWWHGCARFNLKQPYWVKDEARNAKYPKCSLCNKPAGNMWGYKNHPPDKIAQRIQGTQPDESAAYWAKEATKC